MDIKSLRQYIQKSEVRSKLLAGFSGAYSIGATTASQGCGESALLLRVATSDVARFEPAIWLGGERIEIIVRPGYVEPAFQ